MIFITSKNQGHKAFSHAMSLAEGIKPILHLIGKRSARCGQKQGQRD